MVLIDAEFDRFFRVVVEVDAKAVRVAGIEKRPDEQGIVRIAGDSHAEGGRDRLADGHLRRHRQRLRSLELSHR